jgi:adenylate cyclase
MTGLPSGAVTLFFSDIEGSTRLVKALRDRYPEVLAQHRKLVRAALSGHGGHELDTQGDGFFAAFSSAKEAVLCALDIQSVHAAHEWPGGTSVRVRIGIHTGHAVPSGGSYTGLTVHRAARISAAARGGQILVSQATQTILEDEEQDLGFQLVELGERHLKDLDRPVRLFEVASDLPGLPTAGPCPSESLRRIVVLPFANISPDPRDEYFADGMTEELIERLAHVTGLRVIARTTAMHYKNSSETALEIGRALRVGMVLECSVRKAGNRIRITAQLIETASEEHLWAGRYDRELDDVFAVQEEISEEITRAISAHAPALGGAVTLPVDHGEHDTADMEAYTGFLQARKLYQDKGSEKTIRQALALFEDAVSRDPGFARARVGIASCYLWLSGEGALPLADSTQRARAELTAALARNDALAEAHSALAGLLLGQDDSTRAAVEARRAIELNPSFPDPYRWLAQLEAAAGRIGEAVRLLKEAHRLDPLDVNIIAFLARALFYAGRDAEALEFCERFEHLVPFRINAHRTEYYLGRRDDEKAAESFREMERLRPDSLWVLTYRGILAARRGDAETARQGIKTLRELERDGSLTCLFAGFVYFGLGEMDSFFDCMEQALELHNLPVLELRWSPLYAEAREDPRYPDLMQRQWDQSHAG